MSTTNKSSLDLKSLRSVLIPTAKDKNPVKNIKKIEIELPTFEEYNDISQTTIALTPPAPSPTLTQSASPVSTAKPFQSVYVTSSRVLKKNVVNAVRTAAQVPRDVPFEVFNRYHLNACQSLIEVLQFIGIQNFVPFIQFAKKYVNEELLNYCIYVVARHRREFVESGIQLPPHIFTHPANYVDVTNVESILYNREALGKKITDPVRIDINPDFTATNADPEHLLAYFREDIGINLHHRHWHEVYPNLEVKGFINMDRRGELFIYMHSQILARYNFERLCNGLPPVRKFHRFNESIEEAYYPKLDEASDMKVWSPRQSFARLQDINRDGLVYEVHDLQRWHERIINMIDRGYAIKYNHETGTKEKKTLEEPEAINDLGNTIDAAPDLSYDYDYYGDLHTVGHILIAYCHDPDKRYKEKGGVMGKLEVALRDPMFYRWHAFIDDVVDRYRRKLKPYLLQDKLFQNIQIDSVEINSNNKKNEIRTFWQKDQVDVTNGILSLNEPDLNIDKRPSKVYVYFKHLQHKEFVYKLKVTNSGATAITGVIRIFMAPVEDETRGEMPFNKLRKFMVELDKFTQKLEPGSNEITRESKCSSVTIPFEETFVPVKEDTYTDPDQAYSYCGCGWPHYLLIGKGRTAGYQCTLFVMISDYEKDKVETSTFQTCDNSSLSYCGVRNLKYPDKRPMGFPFDRPMENPGSTLETFMTHADCDPKTEPGCDQKPDDEKNPRKPIPNMYNIKFQVKFEDNVYPGPTIQEEKETA